MNELTTPYMLLPPSKACDRIASSQPMATPMFFGSRRWILKLTPM